MKACCLQPYAISFSQPSFISACRRNNWSRITKVENSFIEHRKNNNAILFFAKYPQAGRVKTRLAVDIGEARALGLYQAFLSDIAKTLSIVEHDVCVCFDPNSDAAKTYFTIHFPFACCTFPQVGTPLGERMQCAFEHIFQQGYGNAVIIGSDTPHLPASLFDVAFEYLNPYDCVIGPSVDGGYYLLGFSNTSFTTSVFHHIDWSTDRVLDQTRKKLSAAHKSWIELDKYRDIDDLNDVRRYFSQNIKSHTTRYIHNHITF